MKVSSDKDQVLTGILSACVWSKEFLAKFTRAHKKSEYFTIGATGTVIQWCLAYYKDYKEAPKYHLQDIYEKELRKGAIDKGEMEMVETVIAVAMIDQEDRNTKFLLDEVSKLTSIYDMNALKDELEYAIEREDFKKVEALLEQKRKINEVQTSKSVDPFKDDYAIECVFSQSQEPLFHVKGALGNLINNHLKRDSLIAILAPEKRGKSQLMMELAMRATMSRCNVAMFQVGDLSDYQFFRRMWSWMIGKTADEWRVGKEIQIPEMDCLLNQNNTCIRAGRVSCGQSILDATGKQISELPEGYVACKRCHMRDLSFKGAVTMIPSVLDSMITEEDCIRWRKVFQYRTKGRRFKVSTHSNSTVNVADLNNILLKWKYEEQYEPDVIVIDYADILAPEDSKKDQRTIQDERWRALRRLSQDFNCLVITATQAGRSTYTSDVVSASDVSEDKRKNAHLTGMLGLHQVPEEKSHGVIRVGWLMLREGDFNESEQAVVLQDLSRGQVHLDSYLINYEGKPLFRYSKTITEDSE